MTVVNCEWISPRKIKHFIHKSQVNRWYIRKMWSLFERRTHSWIIYSVHFIQHLFVSVDLQFVPFRSFKQFGRKKFYIFRLPNNKWNRLRRKERKKLFKTKSLSSSSHTQQMILVTRIYLKNIKAIKCFVCGRKDWIDLRCGNLFTVNYVHGRPWKKNGK